MTDRKSYSDPSRESGRTGSPQKGDSFPDRDREKNLGDKNIGSRHREEHSRSGSTGEGNRSSDMEPRR